MTNTKTFTKNGFIFKVSNDGLDLEIIPTATYLKPGKIQFNKDQQSFAFQKYCIKSGILGFNSIIEELSNQIRPDRGDELFPSLTKESFTKLESSKQSFIKNKIILWRETKIKKLISKGVKEYYWEPLINNDKIISPEKIKLHKVIFNCFGPFNYQQIGTNQINSLYNECLKYNINYENNKLLVYLFLKQNGIFSFNYEGFNSKTLLDIKKFIENNPYLQKINEFGPPFNYEFLSGYKVFYEKMNEQCVKLKDVSRKQFRFIEKICLTYDSYTIESKFLLKKIRQATPQDIEYIARKYRKKFTKKEKKELKYSQIYSKLLEQLKSTIKELKINKSDNLKKLNIRDLYNVMIWNEII